MSLYFSPLQRRALEAMGYSLVEMRAPQTGTGRLAQFDLPLRLRADLDRWVGALWAEWPVPPGQPADASFKRALWHRVRDWRRRG